MSEVWKEIGEVISKHDSFLVLSHTRPDGDAIGSELALGISLRMMGKSVEVWNDDSLPRKFRFLPQSHLLKQSPPQPQAFDVVIAVDTATYERLGNGIKLVTSRKCLINIDHHVSNPGYGDINWIDPLAPGSGQIVYELLSKNKYPINGDIAACLYAAILTDTGSFQYPNTTPASLRIAADLLQYGFDLGELSRHIYGSYPLARAKLLRGVLDNLKLEHNNRIAYSWITRDLYNSSGASGEDAEGVIDHLRSIDTVMVAALFEEMKDANKCRVSFRSKHPKVDVNRIASKFGGGGHPEAAGTRIAGTMEEVLEKIISAIREELVAAGL